MARFLTALVAGVGAGLPVAGLCGLVAALTENDEVFIAGWGPLRGKWTVHSRRFAAICVTGLGAGLFTFGLLARPRE
jgi:hypothetical protein